MPDYQSGIDAVTPQDLSRVVDTYFTPTRSYLGLHQPAVTVASGVRAAGIAAGLGFAAWLARRLWRRIRS